MNLGTQTGSVTNHLLSRATNGQPEPRVGMGATILMWSDRHAATITSVLKKVNTTYVTTQDDDAKVVSGSTHDGSATYEFTPNPKGRIRHFKSVGPDGGWKQIRWNDDSKRWNQVPGGGQGLRIGQREEYYDHSF